MVRIYEERTFPYGAEKLDVLVPTDLTFEHRRAFRKALHEKPDTLPAGVYHCVPDEKPTTIQKVTQMVIL